MRFMRTRKSGVDPDIPVFEFAFGKEELKLLLGLATNARRHLPDLFEITPTRNRLNNIIRSFSETLLKYNNKKLK